MGNNFFRFFKNLNHMNAFISSHYYMLRFFQIFIKGFRFVNLIQKLALEFILAQLYKIPHDYFWHEISSSIFNNIEIGKEKKFCRLDIFKLLIASVSICSRSLS